MNALWSDVAILAFTFGSRVLFCVKYGRKTVLSRYNCRLAQWVWLKVRCVDAFHANQRIFMIDVIDDVDCSPTAEYDRVGMSIEISLLTLYHVSVS